MRDELDPPAEAAIAQRDPSAKPGHPLVATPPTAIEQPHLGIAWNTTYL